LKVCYFPGSLRIVHLCTPEDLIVIPNIGRWVWIAILMWLYSILISKRKLNCKIMKGVEEVTSGNDLITITP